MKIITPLFLLFLLGCNANAQNVKAKLDSLYALALKAKDLEASIKYYGEMLKIDSLNDKALSRRSGLLFNTSRTFKDGEFFIDTSKVQAAFADINKAIKYNPEASNYYQRSLLYESSNELDSAETDLIKATKIKPDYGHYYYSLGLLQLLKKEYLSSLNSCEAGDKHGQKDNYLNTIESNALKSEISKAIGNDIVNNYDSNKIFEIIRNLPEVKKAEDKSLEMRKHGLNMRVSLDKTTNWFYTVTVHDGETNETQFVFKVDAATLKVMNPDGKN